MPKFCTFVGMFLDLLTTGIIYHVKLQLFVTLKSEPGSGSGSALIKKNGSGSAWKPTRINNTDLL